MEMYAAAALILTSLRPLNWPLNNKLSKMETRDTLQEQFGFSQNELPQQPGYRFHLDRRKFFKLFGGGMAVAIVFQDLFSLAGEPAASEAGLPANQVGAWIHIGEDSTVTVYTGKVEVGQKKCIHILQHHKGRCN